MEENIAEKIEECFFCIQVFLLHLYFFLLIQTTTGFLQRIYSPKFDLLPVRRVVQRNRLPWFGHVVRMDNDNWVKKCMTLEVNGRRDPGKPKKTWKQVIASDLRELGITRSLAQHRLNWRKTIVMNSLTHASME